MSDPVGLIGAGGATPVPPHGGAARGAAGDAAFKDLLMQNIERVNELHQDASRAIEDLASGRRDDVEGVALAAQKADNAFRLLQAVRNRVLEAYEEVKTMR